MLVTLLPGAHTCSSRLPSLIASGSLYIGVDTCFDVIFGSCHLTLAYIRLGGTLKALKPAVVHSTQPTDSKFKFCFYSFEVICSLFFSSPQVHVNDMKCLGSSVVQENKDR